MTRCPIAIVATIVFLGGTSHGYVTRTWSWQDLYDEADWVAVCVVSSIEPSEKTIDLGTLRANKAILARKIILAPQLVLKGRPGKRQVSIHLAQRRKAMPQVSHFGEVGTFFTEVTAGESYLMFLKIDDSSEFHPVTGHLGYGRSIIAVRNAGDILGRSLLETTDPERIFGTESESQPVDSR